jgi:hypothetical protein
VEALGLLPEYHFEDCFYLSIEALPADVCGDWNLDGQRAAEEVEGNGEMDGAAVQAALPGEANAGAAFAEVGDWAA